MVLGINSKYVHSSPAVWILAAGVSRFADSVHDVSVIETTVQILEKDTAGIAAQIEALRPDVVGVSVYIWNASVLPPLLKLIRKKLPDSTIVLGGPEAANNPEYGMLGGVDYILRGEGEYELPALLAALEGKPPPEKICGVVEPYSDEYLQSLDGRIAYIESSRGCPFRCAFCLSGGENGIVGGRVKFFPLDIVKEQILKLSKINARTIKFVDRTFNCNAARAYEIFDYVISLPTTRLFHFEVAADLFDERTIALLKNAPLGRIQLEAGLQSFYKPALDASARYAELKKAVENIRELLSSANIHIHVDLIAGLPYETLSEFKNSFDKAYRIGAHTLQLGFLKLIHGSKLREQAETLGICYSEKPPYEIKSSQWLGIDCIKVLKRTEDALQHTYNKKRFLSAIEYVLTASHLRPFDFFCSLGSFVTAHGMSLSDYAERFYSHCVSLPNIDSEKLIDCMTCDWLGMVKGNNAPLFMRFRFVKGRENRNAKEFAEKKLGRKIMRYESTRLSSGEIVFVDSGTCDPVTGLYRVYKFMV
ncbi:MAG: B12-binding domain-containing radical SAM protein [Oscillospiraceae bacterium]|nr:B12-binding domain-containing radical SAM protein [Oscillospiraceae bacterium]